MKTNAKKATITLSRAETRMIESGQPKAYDLKRDVMRAARELAARTHRTVEVYASASRGGYMVEQVTLDDDADDALGLSVPFCACGRRLTECDGSRAGCTGQTGMP